MNNQELIEAYLRGNLEGEALLEVEDKISSDPEFASEVTDHKMVQELIHFQGLLETKGKLARIRQKKLAEETKWRKLKWFMGGGALIVAGVIALFFYQTQSPPNLDTPKKEEQTAISKVERQVVVSTKKDSIIQERNTITELDNNNQSVIRTSPLVTKERLLLDTGKIISLSTEQKQIGLINPKPDNTSKDSGRVLHKETLIDSSNTPVNPCDGVLISAIIKTEKSCEDNPTGKLYVMSVTGGKQPYTFSLNGNSTPTGFPTSVNYFDNMPSGSYHLVISDQNGCIQGFSAEVSSMVCNSKKNIFAPEYGESWSFPIKVGSNAIIRIFDSSGAQVFMTNITNGSPSVWDGRDSNLAPLIAGAYVYQIIYADGTTDQGSVTIVR